MLNKTKGFLAVLLLFFVSPDVIPDDSVVFSLEGTIIRSMAVDPANPAVIYAGLKGAKMGEGLVQRSSDHGKTWKALNNGRAITAYTSDVQCLATHPSKLDNIYAGTWKNGMYRTVNGGKSWRRVPSFPTSDIRSIVFGNSSGTLIYAATASHGVVRSTDDGRSWIICPPAVLDSTFTFAWSLTLDKDKSTVYAQTFGGCFRSQNRGKSWTPLIKPENRKCWDLAVAGEGDLWLAASGDADGALYHSSDNGDTWQIVPDIPNAKYCKIASAYNSGILAAGSWDQGLLLSTDAGKSWQPAVDSLPGPTISAIIPAKDYLTVGTWGNGVAVYRGSYGGQ